MLATHPDGHAYLQFAKPPVELASSALGPKGWHLSLPLQRRNLRGRFDAAPLPGWVELLRWEQGHPGTPGWRFKSGPDRRWELVHDATGERIVGFLYR